MAADRAAGQELAMSKAASTPTEIARPAPARQGRTEPLSDAIDCWKFKNPHPSPRVESMAAPDARARSGTELSAAVVSPTRATNVTASRQPQMRPVDRKRNV